MVLSNCLGQNKSVGPTAPPLLVLEELFTLIEE